MHRHAVAISNEPEVRHRDVDEAKALAQQPLVSLRVGPPSRHRDVEQPALVMITSVITTRIRARRQRFVPAAFLMMILHLISPRGGPPE